MTAQQLLDAASQYQTIASDSTAQQVIIYLLNQITGGGGVSGSGITFSNYGGGQPTFTPATGGGAAVDTSTGRFWLYFNGQWN